jgi:predicted nucleotidyltransferase
MPALAAASLTDTERRVLERLVGLLQKEFGSDLSAVWLYGSRARGEQPDPESDVDVLVVVRDERARDNFKVVELVDGAARAEGMSPVFFSTLIYTADRIAQRREIRSFFIQEVDRDKIVLYGQP